MAKNIKGGNESNLQKKKFIPIVLLIVFFSVFSVLFIFNNDDDSSNSNSKQNDVSLQQQESFVPRYESANSAIAFTEMDKLAKEWASDVQYVDCSGNVYPYEIEGGEKGYVGGENGAYPSWGCTIYSKSKRQDVRVVWRTGSAKLESDDPYVWGTAKYEQNPNDRDFYKLTDFKYSSDRIYEELLNSEFNSDKEYATIAFGFWGASSKYGNKPVWEVQIYSRTELENENDEYSQGKLLRTEFYEGRTGTKL